MPSLTSGRVAILLLLTFFGLWGAWAIVADNQPAFADSMLPDSLRLWQALRGNEDFSSVLRATTYRPPLGYLLASLVFLVTGPSLAVLRLTVLLQYLATLFLVYDMGRIVSGRQAGLLGVVLVGTFPLFFGWGRMSFMDISVALLLCLLLRLLLTCDLDRVKDGVKLGLAAGLGLLTKVSFVLFGLFPLVWMAAVKVRRPRHLLSLAAGTLAALALAGWWYGSQWEMVLLNREMSSDPMVARELWGPAMQHFRFYLLEVDGVGWLAGCALLAALAAWRLRAVSGRALALLAGTAVTSIAVLLPFHTAARYILPLVPVAGLLAGVSLWSAVAVFGRRLASTAAGALSLFLLGHFLALNLGLPLPSARPMDYIYVGGRLDSMALLAPDRRDYGQLEAALSFAEKRFGYCVVVFAGYLVWEVFLCDSIVAFAHGRRELGIIDNPADLPPEGPRRICLLKVSGPTEANEWKEGIIKEVKHNELCRTYGWAMAARRRVRLGAWGPAPTGLRHVLFEVDRRELPTRIWQPGFCRYRKSDIDLKYEQLKSGR